MVEPPRWSAEQLAANSERATTIFRDERLEEPLEAYLDAFERCQGDVEELFETTVDLTDFDSASVEFLTKPRLQNAFRFLAGPFISEDDLETVAEVPSLSAKALRADEASVERIVRTVRTVLDRRRFPWISEEREPQEAEKQAAILATAALMATQAVGTERRGKSKDQLEAQTEGALLALGFTKVARRTVRTLVDAPAIGQFCPESKFGRKKADFVVRLWDQRILAIECKASNSAVNSIKRLNHEAVGKANEWRTEFGTTQLVTAAVLSGVFNITNLRTAQESGLAIFWGHDVHQLTDWIESTRNAG